MLKSMVMGSKPLRWLFAVCLSAALMACASVAGPKLVVHAFSFDGWNDGWQPTVELLEYAYGDQYSEVRGKAEPGDIAGVRSSINGPMQVGDFLYVKWRLKATGDVFEERVGLQDRLPRDMTDHELTFVIDGRQLHIYVVTPERKSAYAEAPGLQTWRSKFAKTYEIFPNQPPR